ncbi:antibiotic biosynthesis monooxygenase family protein [Marinobacter sp. 1Y8]
MPNKWLLTDVPTLRSGTPQSQSVRNQGEIEVIARIWKGWTSRGNAVAYEELFRGVVLPKVTQGVSGYISTNLLRRDVGEEIEFTTIFWFESLEAVKNFAGSSYEHAVVPDQVKELMSHYEETVHHYDVAL